MKKITFLFLALFMSFAGFSQGADCANPIVIGSLPYNTSDDTANYGDDYENGSSDCSAYYMSGDDVFYTYTPAADIVVDITMSGISATYSGIHVLDACVDATPNCVAFGGNSGTGDRVLDDVSLMGGVTYYIAISTWATPQSVAYTLDIVESLCVSPTATGTAVDDCANNQFSVDVDLTDLGDATTVSISNDGGVAATTGINATGMYTVGPFTAGTPVNITVEHDVYTQCNTDVGLFSDGCPPSNDDFANAIPIACDDNILGSTSAASLDEDDAPDGFGADLDAPNVWYSYSGPAGDITLDLCPSGYDTSVLIYTGTSGNLTLVGGNDDNNAACGQCCQSNVTFAADGTTTYYITVEGYNVGSTGDFDMTVSCVATTPPPANDDCAAAQMLTLTVPASGTTEGATPNAAEEQPTCDLFGSIADVWYTVDLTGGPNDLTINTTITGTSDQANVAVYSACGGLAADSLGCVDGNGGESLTVNGLADGTYYVRVWSDGNAARNSQRTEGTFDIVADATLSTTDFDNGLAFTYYPNPVNNNLSLNAQKDIQNVSVYNMLGQEVIRTAPDANNAEVNMSSLQSGAYFVKVTIENVTETVRIIKN